MKKLVLSSIASMLFVATAANAEIASPTANITVGAEVVASACRVNLNAPDVNVRLPAIDANRFAFEGEGPFISSSDPWVSFIIKAEGSGCSNAVIELDDNGFAPTTGDYAVDGVIYLRDSGNPDHVTGQVAAIVYNHAIDADGNGTPVPVRWGDRIVATASAGSRPADGIIENAIFDFGVYYYNAKHDLAPKASDNYAATLTYTVINP